MGNRPENEVDIEQQNVGPGGEAGGGEWPDPDAPPTGPTAGEHHRSPGGDAGDGGFKEAVEADPVAGGAGSTPPDDDPRDRHDSPDPSAGGP